jgi:malate dehydrogenase (oxaloacetate-decarboxylating)(NADP+)
MTSNSIEQRNKLWRFLHHPSHFFEILASKNNTALILKNNRFNKGTGFTMEEREKYGLRGLLPPVVESIDQQAKRAYAQFRAAASPIQQYIYLASLKERNETVFYYLLINHLEELCPIVYTPTVGEACLKFGHIWRAAEGMYISHHDRGQIRKILDNWPAKEIGIIVVTDGSRILGLGDLGANGMGIPIGKLSLYIAAAGFHPSVTLPILLDAGTNNKTLLADDRYLGCREPRIPDSEYYPFLDEFLMAVKDKWPTALVQFEDFSNDHCFELLDKYRNKLLCFNDDIQGTGAVITAGFINAVKLSGLPLVKHRLVFFGAGSAAYGVANQILNLFEDVGISREEARKSFYFVDSKGLITRDRQKLEPHKVEFARKDIDSKTTSLPTLLDVVRYVKPTALIGLSGQGGAFTPEVLREAAKYSHRPIIFPLSNPTKNSECDAQTAVECTDGRCIFASGSPFPDVEYQSRKFTPSQGNNMYIFPGLGYGAWLCGATKVSDGMIDASARALAECATQEDLGAGRIYPPISKIREISAVIAARVMEAAIREGLAQFQPPRGQILDYVKKTMYYPHYLPMNLEEAKEHARL